MRDWFCPTYAACAGLPAVTDQHVQHWDIVDHGAGEVEQAVLDVATSDARAGPPLCLDVVVKCAFSVDPERFREVGTRSVGDGVWYITASDIGNLLRIISGPGGTDDRLRQVQAEVQRLASASRQAAR